MYNPTAKFTLSAAVHCNNYVLLSQNPMAHLDLSQGTSVQIMELESFLPSRLKQLKSWLLNTTNYLLLLVQFHVVHYMHSTLVLCKFW